MVHLYEPNTVEDLTGRLEGKASKPTVERHLRRLRKAGMIVDGELKLTKLGEAQIDTDGFFDDAE